MLMVQRSLPFGKTFVRLSVGELRGKYMAGNEVFVQRRDIAVIDDR